ncbi:MAG: DUF4835 family protein [Bacteroidota bacterium]
MKKWTLLPLFALMLQWLPAQEMNFSVTINTPQLQLTDPAVFENLQQLMENFLNNQKWTDDVFEVEERIQCQIQLNIKQELSPTSFQGDMQIQATRPIFNSTAKTPILSHNDTDVLFEFEPFQPLDYSKNAFVDNLTSILSFYVYFILGLDYDSFSPYGGEPHFKTAMAILNTVPPSIAAQSKGWRALDGNRNRYWMVESVMSPRLRPYRKAIYDYHREGLDIMADDAPAGRAVMVSVLEEIGKADKAYPNSMIIQMFVNAKSQEIIEIFKKGDRAQKTSVKRVMARMDAANASDYRKIGS